MKKVFILLSLLLTLGCENSEVREIKGSQIYSEKGSLEGYFKYNYSESGELLEGKSYNKNGKLKNRMIYDYGDREFLKVDSIKLSTSKKVLFADGEDSIKINVDLYNIYGEKLSNKEVKIYVNGKEYKKKKFKTKEVGEHSLIAKIDGVESKVIWLRSREHTNPIQSDYLDFFNHKKLHEIEMKISRKEWNNLLDNLKKNQKDSNYVKGDMIYRGDLGTIKMNSVGFRVRGNASRGIPEDSQGYRKVPFKIKFNETFDMKKSDKGYKKLDNRKLFTMTNLNLKWNRRYDDTQIREMFNYELLKKAGLTVPRTASVLLKINIDGEIHNYGLYTVVESIDEEFLSKNYGIGNDSGDLYKCLYPATLSLKSIQNKYSIGVKNSEMNYRPIYDLKTNKKKSKHKELVNFIHSVDFYRKESLAKYLDKNFEIDKFLRYMAINSLIGMSDDYRDNSNNYYLYFNNSGKIEFLPYDYDSGLGGGWPGWRFDETVKQDIYRESDKSILCSKVLGVKKYLVKYENYLKEFADYESGIFNYSDFKKKYFIMNKIYSGKIENEMKQGDKMILDPIVEKYFKEKLLNVREQLGMLPVVVRAPKSPDESIDSIKKFFEKLNSLEVEKREEFVYNNFENISSKTEFPIIEGEDVTFVYYLEGRKANRIELRGEMNGWGFDENNDVSIEFQNVEGTDIYIYKMKIAKGEYEYKITKNNIKISKEGFEKLSDEEKMKLAGKLEWIMDSLNMKERSGGFGANSLLVVPE